jgi:hypothetical protein
MLVFDITGDTDWWVRDFAHTAGDPIQLAWQEDLVEKYRADTLLHNLFDDYSSVYMILPDNAVGVDTIMWDTLRAYDRINDFYLLEPSDASAFVIDRVDPGSEATRSMIQINNPANVVIGGEGCFVTPEDPACLTIADNNNGLADGGPTDMGTITIFPDDGSNPASITVKANVKYAQGFGFNHSASASEETQSFYFAGLYESSGIRLNSGIGTVYMDPDYTVVTDPLGQGLGWDGDADGSNT